MILVAKAKDTIIEEDAEYESNLAEVIEVKMKLQLRQRELKPTVHIICFAPVSDACGGETMAFLG